MEEIKKVLLLVLGCAVQVGLGRGYRGFGVQRFTPSHLVFVSVGIKLPPLRRRGRSEAAFSVTWQKVASGFLREK